MYLDAQTDRKARHYRAFLNGQPVEYCAAGDDEEGWVEVYLKDENGHFFRDEENLLRFRLHGKIEFRKL